VPADVLIRCGWVADGHRQPAVLGDVAIEDGRDRSTVGVSRRLQRRRA
jgi:hypothetical protein